MSKRKDTGKLVAELRQFNHHEAAAKLQELEAGLHNTHEALAHVADNYLHVKRISLCSNNGEFAFMVDTRVGWQDPNGGAFSEKVKAHLDSILKEGGRYDIRVHVEL